MPGSARWLCSDRARARRALQEQAGFLRGVQLEGPLLPACNGEILPRLVTVRGKVYELLGTAMQACTLRTWRMMPEKRTRR